MASTISLAQVEEKKRRQPPPFLVIVPFKASLSSSKSPGSPMSLSSATYYAKRAISIYEILSPVDINMACSIAKTPQIPHMTCADIPSVPANCKFEHPGANNQGSNPFSTNNSNNSGGGFAKGGGGFGTNSYSLHPDTIVKDLTEERPQWILSAYGPGRDAPEQLWGGAVEQSFEEMRLHFEMGAAAGNPQGAVSLSHLRGSSLYGKGYANWHR